MNSSLSVLRVMVITAAALLVVGVGWLLLRIGEVVFLLILGIILAGAIEPFVYRLRRLGLTRGQSILAVYAALILLAGLAMYLIFPPLVRQGGALIDNIPDILDNLEDQARDSDNEFIRQTGASTIDRMAEFYDEFQDNPPIEGATAVQFVTSTFGILLTTITVLIVAFYWMTEKAIVKRLILGLFPIQYRDRAHSIWDSIEAKIGGWTRGQAILCIVIGVVSAAAYSPVAFDLPFWLALGILAGVTEIIPFIGPWIGGTVATVVALTQSVEKAVVVVIFVVVLQQLEGAVLVPRVMKNAVGLTPLTVILAVQVGSALSGPIGAVLAIPIAGAFQVLVQDLLKSRVSTTGLGGEAGTLVARGEVPGERPAGGRLASEGERAGGAVLPQAMPLVGPAESAAVGEQLVAPSPKPAMARGKVPSRAARRQQPVHRHAKPRVVHDVAVAPEPTTGD